MGNVFFPLRDALGKKSGFQRCLFYFNFMDTCFSVTLYRFYHVYLSGREKPPEVFDRRLPTKRGDELLIFDVF